MIVKVVVKEDPKEVSVWNQDGDRLYYSDREEDWQVGRDLLKDQIFPPKVNGVPGRISGHFTAYWLKKVVQITKRVHGYNW